MGTNRLDRQMGLEWWLKQVEAFESTAYDCIKMSTLKQRLCSNITRLITKTQTVGGVVEMGLEKYIASKRHASTPARKAELCENSMKSLLYASEVPEGVLR